MVLPPTRQGFNCNSHQPQDFVQDNQLDRKTRAFAPEVVCDVIEALKAFEQIFVELRELSKGIEEFKYVCLSKISTNCCERFFAQARRLAGSEYRS